MSPLYQTQVQIKTVAEKKRKEEEEEKGKEEEGRECG